jgi:hypothetical protein
MYIISKIFPNFHSPILKQHYETSKQCTDIKYTDKQNCNNFIFIISPNKN